ncbi:MAG: arginine--tRNA ligase, partial [Gloeobacteraceae cyanobacterium ES-bin-316]|nr:arginine--tRNA ligase [Ferruginibacter sp.]
MSIAQELRMAVVKSLHDLYQISFTEADFQVNQTKEEFEGDYTVVLFSLLKKTAKNPQALGEELGGALMKDHPQLFTGFNIIKGFLNLHINDGFWLNILQQQYTNESYGILAANGQKVMVEYSSPNTNKPLHLGHLRNNFLGWSTAAILEANGYDTVKTCIANDRGIHICKSMVAWQLFANGTTPQSAGMKGDHFVGDYYVLFGAELKKQVEAL